MSRPDPLVSFVVIGLNEAVHLAECIESLSHQKFDRQSIEILYVDSESTDGSPGIARKAGADRVLTIPRATANAARARNAGLADVRAPFVQFVDGDTRLEPGWGRIGVDALKADPKLIGVEGSMRERNPNASVYNAVCELDWRLAAGEIDFVGGNGLYRVASLRESGAFDPNMRVGEEPELGVRLRTQGWTMRQLDAPMAIHDLELFSFTGYLRRCHTGGKACALVVGATGGARSGYWSERMWRTLAHAFVLAAPIALALFLLPFKPRSALAVGCLSLMALLILAVRKSRKTPRADTPPSITLAYGLHSYISKIPTAVGILTVIFAGWVEPPRQR